jgi:SAM-dependent methyltransferase
MSSEKLEQKINRSKELKPGADNYRAYVGPPKQFDFMGATQFALLFLLGVREEHSVLDVGCGSLRTGRLFLQFLLPGRYVGVEPNTWLWQDAIAHEIGEDIVRLKEPRFIEDETFSLDKLDRYFDFVVLQSILSHTGGDLFDRALEQAGKVLRPRGQLLFTVLDEFSASYSGCLDGNGESGWIYPKCVTFDQSDVVKRCAQAGLNAQRIGWFHPRQSWYRAVTEQDQVLSEGEMAQMGTGRPLFDDRFS